MPLVLLCGCQPWKPPQYAPNPRPVVIQEYPATGIPPVGTPQLFPAGPPYLQPSPEIIQPAPSVTPVFPPGSTVVPLPSQTPGSIFGPPVLGAPIPGAPAAGGPLADIAPGGMMSPQFGLPAGPESLDVLPSTITVPVTNDEWAWDQITDVVSDYFTITAEQPARRGAEAFAEGRIETLPQDGATWLEPHRHDSVGRFNRWESTFQTIRRRALVRVLPDATGYTIEVAVEKELEDLPQPIRATAGAAAFQYDGSPSSVQSRSDRVQRAPVASRWIPLGRDPPLEQRMLTEMHARLTGAATAASPILWSR